VRVVGERLCSYGHGLEHARTLSIRVAGQKSASEMPPRQSLRPPRQGCAGIDDLSH
jgi:hypothetical protein